MAYLTPEEEKRQQQAAAMAPPSAAAPGAGPAAAPAAPQRPASPAGSGFTNLSAYLGANASQGAAMADTLAQRVEGDAGAIRGEADAWAQKQEEAARAGVPASGDWEVGYKGPAAPDDAGLGALRDRATAGGARAEGLASQGGRAVQLADVYGGKGQPYGGGARGLDSALAGAYGGERLKAAQGGYAALGEYLGAAGTRAQGAVDTAKADATKRQETARKTWESGLSADYEAQQAEDARVRERQRQQRQREGRTGGRGFQGVPQ